MLFSNLAEMYFDSRIQSTRSMFEKLLSHSDESLAFSKILPILNSEDGPNLSNFELAVQNFIPAQFFCACIYTSY